MHYKFSTNLLISPLYPAEGVILCLQTIKLVSKHCIQPTMNRFYTIRNYFQTVLPEPAYTCIVNIDSHSNRDRNIDGSHLRHTPAKTHTNYIYLIYSNTIATPPSKIRTRRSKLAFVRFGIPNTQHKSTRHQMTDTQKIYIYLKYKCASRQSDWKRCR